MAARLPIIIVGGGPAGLALATILALQGVESIVLEAEAKLPRDLRAGSFHPPTMEMLDRIGVGQDFLAQGYRVSRWQIRDRAHGPIVEWDLSLIADLTPYPFRFHCEQFKLTPLLLRRFEGLGGKPRFAHRFIDATQDEDGVAARVETPAGVEIIRGSYLVGADGGRSPVRHAMQVAFEGFTWPERFLVVGIDRDLAPEGFTMNAYVSDPVDWSAIFKMPHEAGRQRHAFEQSAGRLRPERRAARRIQPGGEERPGMEARGGGRSARQIRAPAARRQHRIRPGAVDPQQAAVGGARSAKAR